MDVVWPVLGAVAALVVFGDVVSVLEASAKTLLVGAVDRRRLVVFVRVVPRLVVSVDVPPGMGNGLRDAERPRHQDPPYLRLPPWLPEVAVVPVARLRRPPSHPAVPPERLV